MYYDHIYGISLGHSMKSPPNTCMRSFNQHGLLLAIFLTMFISCSWEEVREGGYNTLKESQTQRCLDHPSRPPAECLNQPSYETYQKQKETTH